MNNVDKKVKQIKDALDAGKAPEWAEEFLKLEIAKDNDWCRANSSDTYRSNGSGKYEAWRNSITKEKRDLLARISK